MLESFSGRDKQSVQNVGPPNCSRISTKKLRLYFKPPIVLKNRIHKRLHPMRIYTFNEKMPQASVQTITDEMCLISYLVDGLEKTFLLGANADALKAKEATTRVRRGAMVLGQFVHCTTLQELVCLMFQRWMPTSAAAIVGR